jgi:8-oxo-dGTP pyrophosphatase MutT (NUDIX family)
VKIVVKSLIFDESDNLLILIRSRTHPVYANEEDLPGGELEATELPPDSVIREIQEETGLKIAPSEARMVLRKVVEPNTTHILFICRVLSTKPSIRLSWEHSSYKWAKINEGRMLQSKDDYISTANEWLLSNSSIR